MEIPIDEVIEELVAWKASIRSGAFEGEWIVQGARRIQDWMFD